jgi:PAS domain S-box-containing protein
MTTPQTPPIDYREVFQALPVMVALLTPDLVYADVNRDFARLSGRSREQLVGHHLFDVFPDNPNDPAATGSRNLEASLRRVMATAERDTMALQRYDVESTTRPGHWEKRYWSPINAPVLDENGRVALLLHRVEEVTELIRARGRADASAGAAGTAGDAGGRTSVLEAELYTRARELQDAMLPAPRPMDHHRSAVRYRPATGALNVCGDWYDLVEMPGERTVVAVGDVVGHGLSAAGVMGQLRSALSAASRVSAGPAQALEVLGLYARSVEGAESTTVVTAYIDWGARTLTYSSAGHPPPALLHGDGTVEFLDQATDPPLGARPEHTARPEASTGFAAGDTLVLYTDGLVERRREDIDAGLARLAATLSAHLTTGPEELADALLLDLLPPGGATDDTALVVIRL